MTPYEINILLWYYVRGEDHPDTLSRPPIFQLTMRSFAALELITAGDDGMAWKLTPRGRAYCEALQRVPLPEPRWVVCWPDERLMTVPEDHAHGDDSASDAKGC